MERDAKEHANQEAFKKDFGDEPELFADVDDAFERLAPDVFAAEAARRLQESSEALAEGGARLHDMAKEKGGTLTPEERAEGDLIEEAGKNVAATLVAKLNAIARGELPPPLPSKEEQERRKERKKLGGLMTAELSSFAEREFGEGASPSATRADVWDEVGRVEAELEARQDDRRVGTGREAERDEMSGVSLARLELKLMNAGIRRERIAKLLAAAEERPEVAENAVRALVSKTKRARHVARGETEKIRRNGEDQDVVRRRPRGAREAEGGAQERDVRIQGGARRIRGRKRAKDAFRAHEDR